MSFNSYFILASASKSRMFILKKLKLNFKAYKPSCNEDDFKKEFIKKNFSSTKISLELAKIKAKSVSIKKRNLLVVGSDSIVDLNGKALYKAKNFKKAASNIKKLSGKHHRLISSAVAYYNSKLVWSATEETVVKIRKLKSFEISQYLNLCGLDVLNSVGCYQIEKKGPIIIEEIKGDFFNVMGFPLFSFLKFLKKFNIKK